MNSTRRLEPWWRNPYLVLLASVLSLLLFSECAPLFNIRVSCFHRDFFDGAIDNINLAASCLGSLVMYLVLLPRRKGER